MCVNPVTWKVKDPDINNFQTTSYQDYPDTLLLSFQPLETWKFSSVNQSTPAVMFIPVNIIVKWLMAPPLGHMWNNTVPEHVASFSNANLKCATSFCWKSGKLIGNPNGFPKTT